MEDFNSIEKLAVKHHGEVMVSGNMSFNDAAIWILNRTDNNSRGDLQPYEWFDYLSCDARTLENWSIERI